MSMCSLIGVLGIVGVDFCNFFWIFVITIFGVVLMDGFMHSTSSIFYVCICGVFYLGRRAWPCWPPWRSAYLSWVASSLRGLQR